MSEDDPVKRLLRAEAEKQEVNRLRKEQIELKKRLAKEGFATLCGHLRDWVERVKVEASFGADLFEREEGAARLKIKGVVCDIGIDDTIPGLRIISQNHKHVSVKPQQDGTGTQWYVHNGVGMLGAQIGDTKKLAEEIFNGIDEKDRMNFFMYSR